MANRKRKLTSAQRRAKKQRRKNEMMIFVGGKMIFVGGKQKWVRRPPSIDGQSVDEFIANNADPLWLHMNGMWESIPIEQDSDFPSHDSSVPGDDALPF